jgi:hypothetical protein
MKIKPGLPPYPMPPRWSIPWKSRLTRAAENDLQQIIQWTAGKYGQRQAKTYGITLAKAIKDLANGFSIPGVRFCRPERKPSSSFDSYFFPLCCVKHF